jgi:DNA invertase Pin-like site-specific DNA recombinase
VIDSLAIPFRNHAHRLRTRFDQRPRHDGAGLRAEGGWLRANLPEKALGGRWNRPQLQRVLDHIRKGDVLVVWKVDRLSRSLRDVLTLMERIQESKTAFRGLPEAIDTTTPAGRMMMHMVGSFVEFERAMLRERTRAGLEYARDEGRIGGRRPTLLPQQQTDVVSFKVRRPRRMRLDSSMCIPRRSQGSLHVPAAKSPTSGSSKMALP